MVYRYIYVSYYALQVQDFCSVSVNYITPVVCSSSKYASLSRLIPPGCNTRSANCDCLCQLDLKRLDLSHLDPGAHSGSPKYGPSRFLLVHFHCFLGSGSMAWSPGHGFTCAVRDTGALWCWGGNHNGQLGPLIYYRNIVWIISRVVR